jgi:hypothetical protein
VTQIRDPRMTGRDDVELLLSDLASVSGALGEIATTWRRARLDQPQLPLALPAQLQGFVTGLAAAIRAYTGHGPAQPAGQGPAQPAGQGPAQPAGQALRLPEQLSALKQRIDVAQSITCGYSSLQVGDDRLWESVNAALGQAADRVHQTGDAARQPAR